MQRNLFIHADEVRSGKSIISFSLIKALRAVYPNVAFFRPITNNISTKEDLHIKSAVDYLGLETKINEMHGPSLKTVTSKITKGCYNDIIAEIETNFLKLKKEHDVIVCDGVVLPSSLLAIKANINLEIASSLNCELIFVINANNKSISDLLEELLAKSHLLTQNNCRVVGIIINRALPVQIPSLKESIQELELPYKILGIVPEHNALAKPSISDVQKILAANIIIGEEQSNRIVYNQVIAAKQTNNFLKSNHSKADSLIITPGDRQDILLASVLADQSNLYPKISGIILTAGFKPDPIVKQILEGLSNCPTIMLSNLTTFEVAEKLSSAHYATAISSKEKIDTGCAHVLEHLDLDAIKTENNFLQEPTNRYMLQNHLLTKIIPKKSHIVFPEGEDIRVITAAIKLTSQNAARITVLGCPENIKTIADSHNLDLAGINIIQPSLANEKIKYAKHLYEKRKHKNMSINIAEDMINDNTMFATVMVDIGDADGMVSGATHTTSETIRPALQLIKAKANHPFVCSIFVMCMQNKVIIYGDCALTINPDAKQLAYIAESAAGMAKLLNLSPKVALLSYSSGGSGHGVSVDKVRQASEILTTNCPDLAIAGPIQYDAAVDPKVGKRKLPNNPVAGQANVLIFPDLDTGNNTYKAVQREAKGLAIGPILLGLNKPINDLSRGCDADEIYMTALITIIQAQGE